LKWETQLRELVVEGAREGVTFADMAKRLVDAYPALKVAEVERALREQVTLARLFGRQKKS